MSIESDDRPQEAAGDEVVVPIVVERDPEGIGTFHEEVASVEYEGNEVSISRMMFSPFGFYICVNGERRMKVDIEPMFRVLVEEVLNIGDE